MCREFDKYNDFFLLLKLLHTKTTVRGRANQYCHSYILFIAVIFLFHLFLLATQTLSSLKKTVQGGGASTVTLTFFSLVDLAASFLLYHSLLAAKTLTGTKMTPDQN